MRDLGLGYPSIGDLDFFVEGTPDTTIPFIHKVRASLVPEDKSRALRLDFSPCKSARYLVHQFDFTVNSILYDLDARTLSGPTEGLKDLDRRLLRMNSPTFFVTSYRSFVRVFRLAASRQMTIDQAVEDCIRCHHQMMQYASPVVRTKVYLELLSLLCEANLPELIGRLCGVEVLFSLLPHLLIDKAQHQSGTSWEMRAITAIKRNLDQLPEGPRTQFEKVQSCITEVHGQSYQVYCSEQAILAMAVLIARIGSSMQSLDLDLPAPFSKPEYAVNGRRALVRDLLSGLTPVAPFAQALQLCLILNEVTEGVSGADIPAQACQLATFYQEVLGVLRA